MSQNSWKIFSALKRSENKFVRENSKQKKNKNSRKLFSFFILALNNYKQL